MWVPKMFNAIFRNRTSCHRLTYTENSFLLPLFSLQLEQIRARKRNLKKPLTKQQRLERRLKREEKEAKRKQYNFMQRVQIRRMSKLLSPSQQYPGRYDSVAENDLVQNVNFDVFCRSQHRTQFYSITKALELHRLLQLPSIYNHPNGSLKLRCELNMTTDRATKIVPNSEQLVPVLNPFNHNEKRAILALAASKENQDLAVEAGAEIALGTDMVKKILKGQFLINDYDFCVAHSDVGSTLLPLRGILRSKFPTVVNGALGNDLPAIIKKFLTGVKLSIKSDPVHPHWGLAESIVGRLDMSNKAIEENIACIVEALCKHRNPALGFFINRATLMVASDKAHFALDLDKYLPILTESDVEKLENRKKKKKAKKMIIEVKQEKYDSLVALM